MDWKILKYFSWNACMFLGVVSVLAWLIWYLFYRPYNFFRDFSDYGFENVSQNSLYKSDNTKRGIINELRRRRKIGQLPASYPNGWFVILETDELPTKSVKEVNVLGINLVAWRGETGKCHVADAYCPHLGAHLGVGGTVHGDCIQCPFHSWSFDGCTGKLKNIPYSNSVPDIAKLRMWNTMEMNGFVYLWYHAENKEPTWLPTEIPEIGSNKWKYRGRTEIRVASHIQDIPENGADVAHLNAVHKSSVLTGTSPEKARFKWEFFTHGWSAAWRPNEEPGHKHEAILTVNHHLSLFNKIDFMKLQVDVCQQGPGIVTMKFDTILGKGVLIQTVTPIEPMLQRVIHRFYSASTFIHPLGLLVLHTEAIQIARDVRIWNRKTFIERPIFTKEDILIKSFRRWYSQFYSENSQKMTIKTNGSTATLKTSF